MSINNPLFSDEMLERYNRMSFEEFIEDDLIKAMIKFTHVDMSMLDKENNIKKSIYDVGHNK